MPSVTVAFHDEHRARNRSGFVKVKARKSGESTWVDIDIGDLSICAFGSLERPPLWLLRELREACDVALVNWEEGANVS